MCTEKRAVIGTEHFQGLAHQFYLGKTTRNNKNYGSHLLHVGGINTLTLVKSSVCLLYV